MRIPAQEAGVVSRREGEPSDIDVGLISGNVEKREDWRGVERAGTTGSSEEASGC